MESLDSVVSADELQEDREIWEEIVVLYAMVDRTEAEDAVLLDLIYTYYVMHSHLRG